MASDGSFVSEFGNVVSAMNVTNLADVGVRDHIHVHLLQDGSKNAALFVGAFIMGMFVMLRLMDYKLQARPFIPWLQLTTWNHFVVAMLFLVHGLSDDTPVWYPEFMIASVALACVVCIGRYSWLHFDFSNAISVVTDFVTHAFLPAMALLWFFTQQRLYHKGGEGPSITGALGILGGIVGLWFVLNYTMRIVRGVWVYGPDASDPLSTRGMLQCLALIALVSVCFGGVAWYAKS